MPVSHRRFRPYRAWPQLVRGRVALIVAAVQLTTLAACGETTVNEPLSAGTLATVSGNGQVGVAGQTLPAPIQVRVLGSDDQPLPGATVTFAVTTGGGTVSPASATSDANGLASTTWTLGKTAGNNVLTVTAGTATMTVAASGTAARASTVSGTSGDNQTTVVNTAVTLPPPCASTMRTAIRWKGSRSPSPLRLAADG